MTKTIREWVDIAEYDLQTAEAMFKAKRYLYVAFMCQQALEKILKAIFVQMKKEIPPRTHNLLYLLDTLGLNLDEKDKSLLAYLNMFYLESRYPGERNRLAKEMDRKKAKDALVGAKGVIKCLRRKLQ